MVITYTLINGRFLNQKNKEFTITVISENVSSTGVTFDIELNDGVTVLRKDCTVSRNEFIVLLKSLAVLLASINVGPVKSSRGVIIKDLVVFDRTVNAFSTVKLMLDQAPLRARAAILYAVEFGLV
jgi:hypothetical protein